ncbi:hypothetical protein AVEN_35107-1 [Araneus ventricosus]|uniref:Uncharacterized protein n=1 Tax=Araneus ventricosus TaxID=182803 RepID=A0A4Y2I5G9_ARAVE|nr:hypothetical protein AVEN_35107-1 [Araneus ventricosus]
MERCYCTKSELELFGPEKIQLAIENSSFVEIHPVASISDSNTIEFQITGLGDAYFDLSHVLLNIQAKILKADGTAFTVNDKCGSINYLLNTMFSECHISLNDRQISSESNYAYKTYIQSTLFHSESSQKNFLRAGMFYKDTAGEFDNTDVTAAGKNLGFKQRYERVKGGKIFDMCGILHIDLGTQPRLLISGTTIRVRLLKAKDDFTLLAASGAFRLQIENISLFIRKCDVSSSIVFVMRLREMASRGCVNSTDCFCCICGSNWIREDAIFSEHGPFLPTSKGFISLAAFNAAVVALRYAAECALTVSSHMRKPAPNFEQE